MDLDLGGRTALVTGAATGIGFEIARVLTEEGARVVLVGRREGLLREAAAELGQASAPEPVVLPYDLTLPDAGKIVAAKAQEMAGAIDILVNTAGTSLPVGIGASEEAWADAYALRVVATRHLAEALLAGMQERRYGRIVNVGGLFELHGPINATTVMNAARTVYFKGFSQEVAKHGITVNTVTPGMIDSEQIRRMYPTPESVEEAARIIPSGRPGQPRDVAALVALLASPLGGYITGEVISVDGGIRRFAF
jgi:3-oxoacyl-[acyl-carrier protein] reductase